MSTTYRSHTLSIEFDQDERYAWMVVTRPNNGSMKFRFKRGCPACIYDADRRAKKWVDLHEGKTTLSIDPTPVRIYPEPPKGRDIWEGRYATDEAQGGDHFFVSVLWVLSGLLILWFVFFGLVVTFGWT